MTATAAEVKARSNDRSEARLASRPVGTPQTSIIEVTPAMAAYFIEKNARNRSVRPNLVNAYARVMAAGGWQVTGESLKFDTAGNLIDGQHRCLAIIKADVPVTMTITRGLDTDAQAVMDSGAKRTAQDYFLMAGVKNASVVSAIARLSERLMMNKSSTNAELISWAEDHPEVHTAAEISVLYKNSIDVHPSVIGVAWMTLSALDLAKTEEFFDSLSTHSTDGSGDPRSALIKRMATARRVGTRLSQEAQLSLIYRAWNAWITGETLHRLPIESRMGNIKIPDPLPVGSKARTHGRRRQVAVVPDVTDADYAEFDWPERPDGVEEV